MEPRPLLAPDPPLEDGVIRLRAATPDDIGPYARAFRDDPRLGWLTGEDPDPTEAIVRERFEQEPSDQFIWMTIAASADDRFLGDLGLCNAHWRHARAEVGFWLARDERGHGYGARALRLLVDWGFRTLGFERLYLKTYPENEATRSLARSVGFTEEGVLREHDIERGERMSLVVAGLLAREWRALSG